ncbi:MAG TPA: hypothetical protein VHN77_13360 [Phycisphaerales bacterium]|nr:hypothetical protein [Phycisphaerales bacterium]
MDGVLCNVRCVVLRAWWAFVLLAGWPALTYAQGREPPVGSGQFTPLDMQDGYSNGFLPLTAWTIVSSLASAGAFLLVLAAWVGLAFFMIRRFINTPGGMAFVQAVYGGDLQGGHFTQRTDAIGKRAALNQEQRSYLYSRLDRARSPFAQARIKKQLERLRHSDARLNELAQKNGAIPVHALGGGASRRRRRRY